MVKSGTKNHGKKKSFVKIQKTKINDSFVSKQLKEFHDSYQNDKTNYYGKALTLRVLRNYHKSTSWLRANIFISKNRILKKIAIGFIGTGGGSNLFDYLFRDKSSRAMIFANMPYNQKATFNENKTVFEEHGITLINDNFFKLCDDGSLQQISSTSEYIVDILHESCLRKMSNILESEKTQFENYIAVSLTVDFGSENDKPARFFVGCGNNIFGYLFSEKDNRETMNNTIAIIVLNILSNQINKPDYEYNSVELSKFPKRTSELTQTENKKYYDNLYKLT